MLVKVSSIALRGVDTVGVEVEVNVMPRGLPHFDIVGLPDKSIEESKHRIKAAFQNSGFDFPDKKIVVNLAPADIGKEGSFYDLPIAVGIFCSLYNYEVPKSALFFGEVSLDGTVRHTKGAFLLSVHAKENKIEKVFIPKPCVMEAASIKGIEVYGVYSLSDLFGYIKGSFSMSPAQVSELRNYDLVDRDVTYEYLQVVGQEYIKRAFEICAAGGHNLIMIGSPGSGKTMLSRSFASLLPPLNEDEAIEVTRIYSSLGKIPPHGTLITRRPFRSPHHTISYAGMIGGGNVPSPGEITLAHRGVLFMDEFSEFNRQVLEGLRQPMEDGNVTVVRSGGSINFPSKFILVAASNPCPCGYYNHPTRQCTCSYNRVKNYQKKLSGPIMDRIDLHVDVQPVKTQDLNKVNNDKKLFIDTKNKIIEARKIQISRFQKEGIYTNSEMNNSHLSLHCNLNSDVTRILMQATDKFSLSARTYFKLIKVARTIADLDSKKEIELKHMAEAIQYRSRLM